MWHEDTILLESKLFETVLMYEPLMAVHAWFI